MLTRDQALLLADAEIGCLQNHISNLEAISTEGAYSEWQAGIEQLRSAILRVTSDVAAVRAAKIQ